MKSKTYLLWILCGILSIGAGFVASQQLDNAASYLMVDDGCGEDDDEDDDGGDDADTMPTQIAA